jgi:hypothetical protein
MKFTIRDLFLVTLIVALAVGWWVNWRVWTAERRGLIEERTTAVENLAASESMVKLYEEHLGGIADLLRAKGWKVYYSYSNGFQVREPMPNSSAPAPNPPKK